MGFVVLNKQPIYRLAPGENVEDISKRLREMIHLQVSDYYLLQNGKRLAQGCQIMDSDDLEVVLRQLGGKGGFGSMLRAIGAQIEKTTNREACRDLSGRRLRDINEEKRLKVWLEKQAEREEEEANKIKKKLNKLMSKPKHDFKDEEYEESRSTLTQNVSDAVEQGFKQLSKDSVPSTSEPNTSGIKRKIEENSSEPNKKQKQKKKAIKGALWIADDIDSDTDSDSSSSSSASETKVTSKIKKKN